MKTEAIRGDFQTQELTHHRDIKNTAIQKPIISGRSDIFGFVRKLTASAAGLLLKINSLIKQFFFQKCPVNAQLELSKFGETLSIVAPAILFPINIYNTCKALSQISQKLQKEGIKSAFENIFDFLTSNVSGVIKTGVGLFSATDKMKWTAFNIAKIATPLAYLTLGLDIAQNIKKIVDFALVLRVQHLFNKAIKENDQFASVSKLIGSLSQRDVSKSFKMDKKEILERLEAIQSGEHKEKAVQQLKRRMIQSSCSQGLEVLIGTTSTVAVGVSLFCPVAASVTVPLAFTAMALSFGKTIGDYALDQHFQNRFARFSNPAKPQQPNDLDEIAGNTEEPLDSDEKDSFPVPSDTQEMPSATGPQSPPPPPPAPPPPAPPPPAPPPPAPPPPAPPPPAPPLPDFLTRRKAPVQQPAVQRTTPPPRGVTIIETLANAIRNTQIY